MPTPVSIVSITGLAIVTCLLTSTPLELSGQQSGNQSIGIGSLAQTTSNKVTAPYTIVLGPSSASLLGTNHTQIFAGPLIDYSWTFAKSLSIEGRASYLFSKQPISDFAGGNAFLASTGVKASFQFDAITLYARLAPGFVNFNQAGVAVTSSGYAIAGRPHFTLDQGGGVEFPLFGAATALRVDVSQILFVETGNPVTAPGSFHLPGHVENHLTLTAGVAHYFGPTTPPLNLELQGDFPRNSIAISYVLQYQQHLDFLAGQLSADSGVSISGSHMFRRWIGVDSSGIFLPGGDSPNYQDGGAETELLGGLRIGLSRDHYGVFGKYRLGAISFASTINQNTASPPLVRSWNFATDAGGTFEYYPTGGHVLFRVDISQQHSHYHSVEVAEPNGSATQPATYTNSPLVLVGAGWRF
jgi:hypothetical protein